VEQPQLQRGNIIENGFLDEFKKAQANLQANIAANRGNTFKYFGPGSGTSPLPIFLAHYNASAAADDPSKYTGSNWTNSTFLGYLARMNPNRSASPRRTQPTVCSETRRSDQRAGGGQPANLFVLNPNVIAANAYQSGRFQHLQRGSVRAQAPPVGRPPVHYELPVRARHELVLPGQRWGTVMQPDVNIPRHAFKVSWSWSVPVGRGQRFGSA